MSEPMPRWRPTSAWAGIAASGRGGHAQGTIGVRLAPIDDRALATIIVRRGCEDRLAAVVNERIGCDLPATGRVGSGPCCDIVWSAPGQWLVIARAADLMADLTAACADLASVTAQGSSRALVEVSGPSARDALAKGFAIDLHPSVFSAGRTAVTAVAHMSVQIWQTDDAPRYVIAVPRSFAGSFWSWLAVSAAAYGYEVAPAVAG